MIDYLPLVIACISLVIVLRFCRSHKTKGRNLVWSRLTPTQQRILEIEHATLSDGQAQEQVLIAFDLVVTELGTAEERTREAINALADLPQKQWTNADYKYNHQLRVRHANYRTTADILISLREDIYHRYQQGYNYFNYVQAEIKRAGIAHEKP